MLKIGLVGIGIMGRTHLENYLRLEKEGLPIRLAALCDIDEEKLNGSSQAGNIDTGKSEIDFSRFAKYTSLEDMLRSESLDMVDVTLPTYLHREISVRCLNSGLHVLCEKPMALDTTECEAMIQAAEQNGKQLMIGHCLRFWPAYVYLKELVEKETYGKTISAEFSRCGGTPAWGPWLLEKKKSGGAMLDMHVHDTDMIQWLFGSPRELSSLARNVIPGSGYDTVSTNYKYEDGKVVHATGDWTLQGDFGFKMAYRVNFERANIVFEDGKVTVNPNEGSAFAPDLSADLGYYYELKYFAESLMQERPITTATPRSTMESIGMVQAEIESADREGAWIKVKD